MLIFLSLLYFLYLSYFNSHHLGLQGHLMYILCIQYYIYNESFKINNYGIPFVRGATIGKNESLMKPYEDV